MVSKEVCWSPKEVCWSLRRCVGLKGGVLVSKEVCWSPKKVLWSIKWSVSLPLDCLSLIRISARGTSPLCGLTL